MKTKYLLCQLIFSVLRIYQSLIQTYKRRAEILWPLKISPNKNFFNFSRLSILGVMNDIKIFYKFPQKEEIYISQLYIIKNFKVRACF